MASKVKAIPMVNTCFNSMRCVCVCVERVWNYVWRRVNSEACWHNDPFFSQREGLHLLMDQPSLCPLLSSVWLLHQINTNGFEYVCVCMRACADDSAEDPLSHVDQL